MPNHDIIYRLTVTDSNGDVITPRNSAIHTDEFRVATKEGVTDGTATYKPYLDYPTGRRGIIELLSRKTDTGQMTVRIVDMRVTPGGDNAERWMTAFTGDIVGRNYLIGKTTLIEESLDNGSTWTDFFKGKIITPATEGRVWMSLTIRDLAEELDIPIFTDEPITSYYPNTTDRYAQYAPLFPLGILTEYSELPLATPVPAVVERTVTGTPEYSVIKPQLYEGLIFSGVPFVCQALKKTPRSQLNTNGNTRLCNGARSRRTFYI